MWYDIFKFGFENRAKIKDLLDPKKRLKGKIDSCLVLSAGNCYPVQFCLNTEQPCLGLYLKINNFSKNLEIVLNGGIIEGIYVNSRSIVQNLQFVDRNDVSPLKSNNIYLGQSLDAASVNRLKEIEDIYNLEARLIIKFNIDNIKLKTERRFSFDNIPCKLSLSKSPLTCYKETAEKRIHMLQEVSYARAFTSGQQDELKFDKNTGTYKSQEGNLRYCAKCYNSSPSKKVPLQESSNGWYCSTCKEFYANPNYNPPRCANNDYDPLGL